ncbi:MAG: NAD+ synthase [Micrococcales bacterium]
MAPIRLAMAQTNPTVGAIRRNLEDCLDAVRNAVALGAEMVVFGEMVVTGYPIEDLAQRDSFLADAELAVADFAVRLNTEGFGGVCVVLGHPARAENPNGWAVAHNAASVLLDGRIHTRYAKHHLPNYSVFDEYRVFVPGDRSVSFDFRGTKFSLLICEDIWQSGGPVSELSANNTQIALVLNGSPFELGKSETRRQLVRDVAREQGCGLVYVNLVGGQDDLVFDGASLACTTGGEIVLEAPAFEPALTLINIDGNQISAESESAAPRTDLALAWSALVLGLRDYVGKNGFPSVVLGLSGGIDSAVCAAIAADAIGAPRVFGVSLPSRYSSDHSKSDAFDLASRIGLNIRTEPIGEMVAVTEAQLGLDGVAAENLQARVRGLILMGLSNQEGHLVLTTGNKTELSVGYSTIYGDSVGGYAPIKDVPKMLVWELARWRNAEALRNGETPPIPENSISKPPSAELRPGQVDQDSLPEYDLLDSILELYVDERRSLEQIAEAGFDKDTVSRILGLVDRAEWKRRQGAIGPKITGMAFGRDRRLPITNAYRR